MTVEERIKYYLKGWEPEPISQVYIFRIYMGLFKDIDKELK